MAVPDRVVTNREIASALGVDPGWIANSRILRAVGQRLGLAPDRVVDYVDRFANSSTATLPSALALAEAEGRLKPGGRILLASFGGGFTWAGTVMEWEPAALPTVPSSVPAAAVSL